MRAMPPTPESLPDDPAALKAIVLAQREEIARLTLTIARLQRQQFGRRSEQQRPPGAPATATAEAGERPDALPPAGPAIPVTAQATSAPKAPRAPASIARHVSSLTAPWRASVSRGTPSSASFASFA